MLSNKSFAEFFGSDQITEEVLNVKIFSVNKLEDSSNTPVLSIRDIIINPDCLENKILNLNSIKGDPKKLIHIKHQNLIFNGN